MFLGVIVPNITIMFAVILFLRIGVTVTVGSVGLPKMSAIVVLYLVIILLTSASSR